MLVASPRVDTIDEARFFADRLVDKDLERRARSSSTGRRPTSASPRASGRSEVAEAALFDNLAELHALASAERDDIAPLVADTGREPTWVPLLPGDVHDLDGTRHDPLAAVHRFSRREGSR